MIKILVDELTCDTCGHTQDMTYREMTWINRFKWCYRILFDLHFRRQLKEDLDIAFYSNTKYRTNRNKNG